VHTIINGGSFRSETSTLLLMIQFCFWRVAGTVTLMTGVKYYTWNSYCVSVDCGSGQ